jgi:hypothetical protein
LQIPYSNVRNIPIGYSAIAIFSIDYQQFPSRQRWQCSTGGSGKRKLVRMNLFLPIFGFLGIVPCAQVYFGSFNGCCRVVLRYFRALFKHPFMKGSFKNQGLLPFDYPPACQSAYRQYGTGSSAGFMRDQLLFIIFWQKLLMD